MYTSMWIWAFRIPYIRISPFPLAIILLYIILSQSGLEKNVGQLRIGRK